MMFVIATALQAASEPYTALEAEIRKLGDWSNRLPNAWLVQSRTSALQIRNRLKPHLRIGDRLFVAQLTNRWAGTGMGEGFPEWLKRRDFGPLPTANDASATP